jgi:hypothetical protein
MDFARSGCGELRFPARTIVAVHFPVGENAVAMVQ